MARAVTIELTVEDAQAVRAWQRSKESIAEFDKQGKKTTKTFGGMFAEQARGVASVAAGFVGVGSAIGGIVTAANLLRNEYDNLVQRQERAANIQLPLADLERQLALNVGGDPNAPIQQKLSIQADVLKYRDDIVKNTGATPAVVTNAFSGALSARGDATIAQTASAVEAAINVAPSDEDIEFLSAGALDLVRGGADAETGANFLAAAGSQLRLTKTAKVAKNAARAVNLARPFGNDERQAVGTFGFLTGEGNDSEGEPAGTALLQLAGQVREISPESTDTVSGLSDIANDPVKQAEFLKKLRGEERFKPIFERLVKDEAYRQTLEAVVARVPSFEQADQLADDQSKLMRALPTSSVRDLKRGIVSTTEGILSDDPTAASSIIREEVPKLEQAYGRGAASQKATAAIREVKSLFGEDAAGSRAATLQQLEDDAAFMRAGGVGSPEITRLGTSASQSQDPLTRLFGMVVSAVTAPKEATERDRANADRLDQLIKLMREQSGSAVDVKVRVNNRPANADVRISPPSGSRKFASLSSAPARGR